MIMVWVGPNLGKELKDGSKCDIEEVSLPEGVGVKMYTFSMDKSWEISGVGRGDGACCEFDPNVSAETCKRTPGNLDDKTTNQVEYLGQFLPKVGPGNTNKKGTFQNKDTGFIEPGATSPSSGASRRLLGSDTRTGICMYDLYILDGYECATTGTPGNSA